MELLLLTGGILYAAVVGFFVMDRLGRFLDKGGISPCWDASEEERGQNRRAEQDGCGRSDSAI